MWMTVTRLMPERMSRSWRRLFGGLGVKEDFEDEGGYDDEKVGRRGEVVHLLRSTAT